MRAKEFILEDYADDFESAEEEKALALHDQWVETMEVLRRDCQPFLKSIDYDVGRYHLWRGDRTAFSNTVEPIVQMTTRMDRLPKDMPIQIHHLLDQYFLTKFGFKYRSQATFATHDYTEAKDYGTPYLFFPIGQFDICYSPHISDLFKYLEDSSIFMDVGNLLNHDEDEAAYQELANDLNQFKYTTQASATAAIDSRCELMIKCKSFYLINCDKFGVIPNDFDILNT